MREAYADPRQAARSAPPLGLIWTDYAFLAAVALTTFLTVNPFHWVLAEHNTLRHLALAMALPVVGLAILLRAALPQRSAAAPRPISAPLGVAWPLALYALMAGGGGAYARSLGADSTFLVYGLYVLMLFLAAAMVVLSHSPLAFLRAYFFILLPAALFMSAMLVVAYGRRQVYHEEIFLVIPMAALALASQRHFLVRWGGAALFLSMGWFSHKLTSYLLAAMTAAYLAVFIWMPRLRDRDPVRTLAAVYWGALGLVGAGAVALLVFMAGGDSNPSGNTEFRLHTYTAAWNRFLESPLWGSLFTREAVEKFTLFDVGVAGNMLPTHSDLLDVLANGGLLAAGLIALGLGRIALLAWRRVLRPALIDRPEAPYAHALALMSLAALVTSWFNPILLQPQMAALAWANLGMLLGLALRCDSTPHDGVAPR
jgi:O-antigen ligase